MASGGWEWRADRGRWVAHAPVESGASVLALIAVGCQAFMWVTGPSKVLWGPRWWLVLPWAAVMVPLGVAAALRLRRMSVTYDGEVVEVRSGPVRTRFRRDDVVAARPDSPAASHLLTVRVRRPERTVGGVRLPSRRTSQVRTHAPAWWWVQVVGLPPERITVGWLRRAWARLRRRPDAHPASTA